MRVLRNPRVEDTRKGFKARWRSLRVDGGIDTVIFDLGEVYLHGLYGTEHRLEPLLKIDAKNIFEGFRGDDLDALFDGRITEDAYWARTISRNGWKMGVEDAKRAVRENFTELEGTHRVIEELKAEGLKLGLLSIHAKEWIDFCSKKFDYHRLFDAVSYSFEAGASKPDIRAYKVILERLGSDPLRCVYVDDKQRNLVPAMELGMRTILFRDAERLRSDLKSLGLLKGQR